MDTILPTQPETNSQLFARSIRLYTKSFRQVFVFAFILAVIAFIPRIISDLIGREVFARLPLYSPYRLWVFVIGYLDLLFFIAILWHMYCVYRDRHEPLIEDLSKGLKKGVTALFASLVQAVILTGIVLIILGIQVMLSKLNILFSQSFWGFVITAIVFVGQFFLILYLYTLFIFMVPLIAIENKGIIAAIERSIYLVWNHWWRTFSLQISPWLVYLAILLAIRYFLRIDIHIYFFEEDQHPLWISLFQLLLFALFIPWVASLLLVQLKDLELRKRIALKDKNAL